MPMSFPDLKSLQRVAEVHKFRTINKDEKEDSYRIALADYVAKIDLIESEEIRNKVGWDKWNDIQKLSMLIKGSYGRD